MRKMAIEVVFLRPTQVYWAVCKAYLLPIPVFLPKVVHARAV